MTTSFDFDPEDEDFEEFREDQSVDDPYDREPDEDDLIFEKERQWELADDARGEVESDDEDWDDDPFFDTDSPLYDDEDF